MFLSVDDLKYHEQRTRYYIARYGYSTSIYLFELLSEPWHLNETYVFGVESNELMDDNTELGENVRGAVYNYHNRMSNYIKNVLNHKEHLIGIDVYENKSGDYHDLSAGIVNVDVLSVNRYTNTPAKLLISKPGENSINIEYDQNNKKENSYYASIKNYHDLYQKPVMMAEGGAAGTNECSNFTPHKVDVMTLGFTGFAGFYPWEGFLHFTGRDQRLALPFTVRAQYHMNGNDVIDVLQGNGGSWAQGRQKEKQYNSHEVESKETQYYISLNQEHAVGFVSNRTYNYYTKKTNANCNDYEYDRVNNLGEDSVINGVVPINNLTDIDWQDGSNNLFVSGLKNNTNYRITWYDFKDYDGDGSDYIFDECLTTNLFDGKLKLKFPSLNVQPGNNDRPVVWFVIDEYNCQQNIAVHSTIEENDSSSIKLSRIAEHIEGQPQLFTVSPNPFESSIDLLSEIDQTFEIVSSINTLVYTGNVSKGTNRIDLSFLSKGIYFINGSSNSINFKIIKL